MINLSSLPKTWLIDVDGTIFAHNSHLTGEDVLLPGVEIFFSMIPVEDTILLLTARKRKYREATLAALVRYGIRYNEVIFDLPVGERILINDRKPSGLQTAYAINVMRDNGLGDLCRGFPEA